MNTEADRIALVKLEDIKKREWSAWFSLNIEPKMKELEAKMRDNAIKALQGPWAFTCKDCGYSRDNMILLPEGIAELMKNGYIKYKCEKRDVNQNIPLIQLIDYYLSS